MRKIVTMLSVMILLIIGGGVMAVSDGAFADDGDSATLVVEKSSVSYTEDVLPTLEELEKYGVTCPSDKIFKGWFVDDGYDGIRVSETLLMPGSTLTKGTIYTADLIDKPKVVTFIDYDGSTFAEIVAENETITVPELPVHDYVKFSGWAKEGAEVDSEGKIPMVQPESEISDITGDTTYIAVWEYNMPVTFIVGDTAVVQNKVLELNFPDAPNKDNYLFVGWAVDGEIILSADATYGDLKDLELAEPTTFRAVFEPTLHTVTFVVNGEIVQELEQTVKHGSKAIEPSYMPVAPEGKVFSGWDYKFDNDNFVKGDIVISAVFVDIVEPAPSGIDDPVVQTVLILVSLIVLVGLAIVVSKVKKGELKLPLVKKTAPPVQEADKE